MTTFITIQQAKAISPIIQICTFHRHLISYYLYLQWQVNVTQMEELQGDQGATEGKDSSQQHHLEGVAYAM